MNGYDAIEAAFVWHIRGLTTALSAHLQRPHEQVTAEVLELVPAVARHIGTLATMHGYAESKDGKFNASSGIIMLVALTLGMGTFKMIESRGTDKSSDPVADKAEVTNLLRDMGFEAKPDDPDQLP